MMNSRLLSGVWLLLVSLSALLVSPVARAEVQTIKLTCELDVIVHHRGIAPEHRHRAG
jgi:hypothetical protein